MKQSNILKSAFILISTFFFINAASCQTKSKTTKHKSTTTSTCAVKVDFASPGTGIDHKTMEEMKKMVDEKKVKYTETRKGKEGETQWCFTLSELKGNAKSEFIEQLKKFAESGQHVSVSTN